MSDKSKKLQRSREDRWLAGVCGGLGEYFNMDATIFRIIFVLLSVFIGGGLLVYIILWIVMPLPAEGEAAESAASEPVEKGPEAAEPDDTEAADEDASEPAAKS